MASAGGVWMALIYGFAGLHDNSGDVAFFPNLPRDWTSLKFRLSRRESVIAVELTHSSMVIGVTGPPTVVSVRDDERVIGDGQVEEFRLEPAAQV